MILVNILIAIKNLKDIIWIKIIQYIKNVMKDVKYAK